jgi:hypothetical protein
MTAAALLGRLATHHIGELMAVNVKLHQMGLPPFFLGLDGFNADYRIYNLKERPPRFVATWKGWRPGLKLAELYLIYMPHVGDREPERNDMITVAV